MLENSPNPSDRDPGEDSRQEAFPQELGRMDHPNLTWLFKECYLPKDSVEITPNLPALTRDIYKTLRNTLIRYLRNHLETSLGSEAAASARVICTEPHTAREVYSLNHTPYGVASVELDVYAAIVTAERMSPPSSGYYLFTSDGAELFRHKACHFAGIMVPEVNDSERAHLAPELQVNSWVLQEALTPEAFYESLNRFNGISDGSPNIIKDTLRRELAMLIGADGPGDSMIDTEFSTGSINAQRTAFELIYRSGKYKVGVGLHGGDHSVSLDVPAALIARLRME